MARKRRDVTDAELAVLELLWARSAASIRDLTNVIYPRGGPSGYATVKKLLARLEAKGLVARDSTDVAHVFTAKINQEELIGRRLQDVAADLCGGSQTPLLMHLLKNREYTAEERKQLHELVDELIRTKPKQNRKR